MEKEIWKDIPGYEGLYQASTLGRIKSIKRMCKSPTGTRIVPERILRPFLGAEYAQISLNKDGKKNYTVVHRLVAKTFLPNPLGLQEINHKDENKKNNALSNLEWCTPKYNMTYGTRILRSAQKQYRAVIAMDSDGNVLGEYASLGHAADAFNVCRATVCGRAKCGRPTYKGIYFKYK